MSEVAVARRRAAFLDRDGTLIEDAHYLAHADQVRLIPGAADAIQALNNAGVLVVVITNQSGIARGIVSEGQYYAVRDRTQHLFALQGARLDATYHCPHHPSVSGHCDCRKPGTLLYERAVRDLAIDPQASLFAGDRLRDVLPAQHFGARGILIPSLETPEPELDVGRRAQETAASLGEAVQRFLEEANRSL